MNPREIRIPHRYGARIYAEDDIIRIEQDQSLGGTINLIFDPVEAKEVAAALTKVAKTVVAEKETRNGNP